MQSERLDDDDIYIYMCVCVCVCMSVCVYMCVGGGYNLVWHKSNTIQIISSQLI